MDGHRRAVRDAALDATATLVHERGPSGVTMSQIAEATGIARATLYRYFPDVDAVLVAWHERQITRHLQELVEISRRTEGAEHRLTAVLEAYARLSSHAQGPAGSAVLHRGGHVQHARHRLRDFLRDLITDAAAAGEVRDDVSGEELATYCLHALGAASEMTGRDGVRRLVDVTVAGLRPRR